MKTLPRNWFVPLRTGGMLMLLAGAAGCLSPIAMNRAVVEYDRTVSRAEAEMLLLNIARARHFHPIHFTAISSVAATFDFRMNAGMTSGFLERPDVDLPALSLGGSVAENPTITIVPIQGEEFTKRMLTPMDESKFEFLFAQGVEPSIILRLMAREIVLTGYGESGVLRNTPKLKEEYQDFRRRILHLSSLNLSKQLHVGPIVYEERWPTTGGGQPGPWEIDTAVGQGYRWLASDEQEAPVLSRKVIGRIAITNYDIRRLTNRDRHELQREALRYPPHSILVDIRPGGPGGDYPLRGWIVLRSFNSMISFVALGIEADKEFHVGKDRRTGETARNPPWTLLIEETESRPDAAAFAVRYENRWYSIREAVKEEGVLNPWNQDAFRILSQLFQMTVTDVSRTPTPVITIAK